MATVQVRYIVNDVDTRPSHSILNLPMAKARGF
jgi:hypothetical protein